MKKEIVVSVIIMLLTFGIIFVNTKYPEITGSVIEEFADSEVRETIVLPVNAYVLVDSSGYYTSFRSKKNVYELVDQANRIWSQADIIYEIQEVKTLEVDFEAVPNAINGNYQKLYNENSDTIDISKTNLFLTQSLNGINGLALLGINSALVADKTTVNDYRTTAHEFGHLLGLRHVNSENRLMSRGKNGETLDSWEIKIARGNAKIILETFEQ